MINSEKMNTIKMNPPPQSQELQKTQWGPHLVTRIGI